MVMTHDHDHDHDDHHDPSHRAGDCQALECRTIAKLLSMTRVDRRRGSSGETPPLIAIDIK